MFDPENYSLATAKPELLKSPWWIGHIPFAFELMQRLTPGKVVELGTYSGSSFFTFCQAAEILHLPTKCYGVDLWEGDIHMGQFEETLYTEIAGYVAERYPESGVLVRRDFNDAAEQFENNSVDLLHIDGTHTLEAVSNDFRTWLPKVSDRGVVLFHDTNATHETVGEAAEHFGVKGFFDSSKSPYRHIEFAHCYGLGVLLVGDNVPAAVKEMVKDAEDPAFYEYFERLGGKVSLRFAEEEAQRVSESTTQVAIPHSKRFDERVKTVALYFPQFHSILENDNWWGKGFTDWHNVKKAGPLYKGHYQPRVPRGERYYDQSQKEVITWQVELAKKAGLYGFCHYHYWFDGVQLLEKPTNLFLRSPELDFSFCLAWANETWSRRWDGQDHHVLIKQTHVPEAHRWLAHFNYLIRAWSDDRAIKIDGKPVFLIYRPHLITHIDQMLDFWREKAHHSGLKGLYFIAIKQYELPFPGVLKHFDAVMQFQPFEAVYSPDFEDKGLTQNKTVQRLRILPEKVLDVLRSARYRLFKSPSFWEYDTVWRHMLKEKREGGLPTFPGAFVDWDNTSRYGKRAKIFRGANPERFEYWFQQLVDQVASRPEPEERLIFVNAWNEWAESAYLEPDERYQHQYLDAVRRCLNGR